MSSKDSDEHLYARAMEEVASKNVDPGAMAKAFALSSGNKDAAIAAYLRMRVESFKLTQAREAAERQQKEDAKRREDERIAWDARIAARRDFDAVQNNVVAVIVYALIGVIALAGLVQLLEWWFGK